MIWPTFPRSAQPKDEKQLDHTAYVPHTPKKEKRKKKRKEKHNVQNVHVSVYTIQK